MRKLLVLVLCLVSFTVFGSEKKELISIGNDVLRHLSKNHPGEYGLKIKEVHDDISLVEINSRDIESISHTAHEHFKRCGGFIHHGDAQDIKSINEAKSFAKMDNEKFSLSQVPFFDYEINQESRVTPLLEKVNDVNIKEVILKLSSFHNRYYNSEHGVKSSLWIKSKWEQLSAHRSDVTVEALQHSSWRQPSIILTIQGETNETIVLGGHADSIAGYFGRASARAPGADDNASGISTITEVLRVLMDSNYMPKKTIKFMAYAAEEVGLRGSKEIARKMKKQKAPIVGVVQFDMTNFKGSDQIDIALVTDYTNADQNLFLAGLIDKYLEGVRWGYDKCGYACSDHASWHSNGFPASMPFEAKKNDMNRLIHTARDTLEVSRGTALHAAKFAKLGLAYIVEMDH